MKKIFFLNALVFLLNFLFLNSLASDFYPSSYDESRKHLDQKVKELKKTYPLISQEAFPIPSNLSDDLKTDVVFIPSMDRNSKKLIVISSGIHGVEAFTGSALQFAYLDRSELDSILQKSSILLIHALNPYGYAFKRRVTENNVDLNRNFLSDTEMFKLPNLKYAVFDDYLNPENRLSMSLWVDIKLFMKTILKLIRYGRKELAQSVLGGQYEKQKGLYFGGHQHEPHVEMIKTIFGKWAESKNQILHIDLHTGYGERGRLHFFSHQQATQIEGFNEIFSGFSIDLGEDKDFYKTSGNFEQSTVENYPDKRVIPMTFEFGTMDSQTTMGGFYSLRNMILENQGFQYGYADELSKQKIQDDFLEMFNPTDSLWRKKVLEEGTQALITVSNRFAQIQL